MPFRKRSADPEQQHLIGGQILHPGYDEPLIRPTSVINTSGSGDTLCYRTDRGDPLHGVAPGGRHGGLTIFTAVVFLVGDMAGSGILALPNAIVNTNWYGFFLLVGCGLMAAYNGRNLARCWVILQERFPEYREHVRYPYPAIGERAVGKWMRVVVSWAIDITITGVSTVFLLIACQNCQSLLHQVGVNISYCYLLLIVGAFMTPLTWFGTPKDFWPIAVGAASTTVVCCILTVIGVLMDKHNQPPVHHSQTDPTSFFLAFGTVLFSFGGAAIFPTIQHDMKQPAKFTHVVVITFITLICLYIPICICGFLVYGDSISTNILQNLPEGALRITVEIIFSVHLVLAFVIAINVPGQDLEEIFKVKHSFGIGRVLLRTCLVMLVVFIGESIPHFGAILDLIGASTVTFLTFVAPALFYTRLTYTGDNWDDIADFFKRGMPVWKFILNILVMTIGVVGGVASTYSAIKEVTSPSTFIPPCYINISAASGGANFNHSAPSGG